MPGRRHRRDVEGLRAVAVLAVVAYHAGLGVPGGFVGVDVFFVLSGFLITGMLVAELDATGGLDLPRFFARRIRRLLPLSLLVAASTVALALALLDPLSAADVVRDAAFAVTGVANWHLVVVGTDYLNASAPPSPLQHYWSLGVEEQFYLCWPALLLLLTAVTRRARSVVRAAVLGAVFAGSLLAAVLTTGSDPVRAYFGTHTRAWELALGALVALTSRRLQGPRRPDRPERPEQPEQPRPTLPWAALSWLGLGGILASVWLIDASVPFPGLAALAPTLATAAVLAGDEVRGGAVEVLAVRPLQALGRWSYGWYLWHWPLLVLLVPRLSDSPPGVVPARAGLTVAGLALALTVVTYRLVERPVRAAAWPLRRPVLTGFAAVAVSATLAVGALGVTAPTASTDSGDRAGSTLPPLPPPPPLPAGTATLTRAPGSPAPTPSPGAAADAVIASALAAGLVLREVPQDVTPPLAQARAQVPAPQRGCHAAFEVTTVDDAFGRTRCVFGDTASPVTVVLYGDSHALQWFPALQRIAQQRHWRLVPMTKSACPPFAVEVWLKEYRRRFTECGAWQASALRQLAALRPALVVLSARTSVDDHGLHGGGAGFDDAWAQGTATAIGRVRTATGAPVVMIEDTPLPPPSTGMVPACLSGHRHDPLACAFDAAAGDWPAQRRRGQRAAAERAGAVVVDPRPWFCTAGRCPVLVSGTLVYRDTDHVSVPYSRWLAPALAARLPALASRPATP